MVVSTLDILPFGQTIAIGIQSLSRVASVVDDWLTVDGSVDGRHKHASLVVVLVARPANALSVR